MLNQAQIKDYVQFPAIEDSTDGIVCMGGDLSPEFLISAYRNGIFPWYNEEDPLLWWSPEERCVVKPGEVKISKSMRSMLKKKQYHVSIDTAFSDVILQCKTIKRKDEDGTWIHKEMVDAYTILHKLGIAHSVEIWDQSNNLQGGLYGVSIGKMFFGESMFSHQSNTSKMAFILLSEFLNGMNFELIDCQVTNNHLKSMGCYEIPREKFININSNSVQANTTIGSWTALFERFYTTYNNH